MDKEQQALHRAFSQILQLDRQAEAYRAAADPKKHKLTRVMGPKGDSYRYYDAGTDGRGWTIRFCYSCWRNAAGYFLGWREVIPPKGSKASFAMKRDQWIARKVRNRAAAKARERADRQVAKNRARPL